ncbi:hypothetical protein T492DRAFT_935714 [Pavlovales sp. CCMP2436]|nr:hypothetical protein T492DRAFT_935714 [Pavlovales sp. CCMP2436]
MQSSADSACVQLLVDFLIIIQWVVIQFVLQSSADSACITRIVLMIRTSYLMTAPAFVCYYFIESSISTLIFHLYDYDYDYDQY